MTLRLSFLLAVLGVSLNGGEVKVRSKARERHYAFGRKRSSVKSLTQHNSKDIYSFKIPRQHI